MVNVPTPNPTRRHCRSLYQVPASIETVFTENFAEEIATLLEGQMKISLIPSALVVHVLTQVIAKIVAADISTQSLESIQEILEAEATPTGFDDVEAGQVNELVSTLAVELNAVIDIPLVKEEKELEILHAILKAVFSVLTTSKQDYEKVVAKNQIQLSHDLLGSAETRRAMVAHINEIVDIPLVGEDQEDILLASAVEICAKAVQDILPGDVIKALSGESPDGIAKTKSLVVDRINEKVDLIGFSEKQERCFIETLVDLLINECVDGTQVEYIFLDAEGQEALLKERRNQVVREGKFSERRFQREQKSVASKLQRIDDRIDEARKRK